MESSCVNRVSASVDETINRIGEFYKNNRRFCNVIFLLMVFVGIMIVRQGIVLNDELLNKAQREYGIINTITSGIGNEMRMGRPLRILAAFNQTLGFIFKNIIASRTVQYCIVVLAFASAAWFTYALIGNKLFSFFVFILALSLFPVTFEHTAPNAFNGLTLIPMLELNISLVHWCRYLESRRKRNLILSICLMLVALMGYEFMVTFLPLFLLIMLIKGKRENKIKDLLKSLLPFVILGVAYVSGMLLLKYVVQGEYDGATIGFVSINSSLKIVWTLFKSAIPGYWLLNGKYRFLYAYYSDTNRDLLLAIPVAVLFGFGILYCFFHRKEDIDKKNPAMWLLYGMGGLIYAFIPSLPNSVAAMYQGNVTDDHFTALPVSPLRMIL